MATPCITYTTESLRSSRIAWPPRSRRQRLRRRGYGLRIPVAAVLMPHPRLPTSALMPEVRALDSPAWRQSIECVHNEIEQHVRAVRDAERPGRHASGWIVVPDVIDQS